MTTSRYVAVSVDGELLIHLPGTTGNYYTLCGLDGGFDGVEDSDGQMILGVPKGAKVNCSECIAMFDVATSYRERDFAREETR